MTTLPDREVWRRLDAALALLGIEPAQNQKAMNAMSAARLILAAGEAAMSPDTRHTANESQATILQTVRLPMVGDFAEAMARFQKDNPELMSLDVAVAFILGSYLTDRGYSYPYPPRYMPPIISRS